MGNRFLELLFSPPVRAVQEAEQSRHLYEKWESKADSNQFLTHREIHFLCKRDSFYIASVSPDGWPYIQHRGGPQGFIKVLDHQHIGFPDYRGNRQYISTGNIRANDRVALFFMDYPNRRRLKMLGFAREIASSNEALLEALRDSDYSAIVERGFVIQVAAFDWNCPQHISPRYNLAELETMQKRRES